jgi:hypothetical protein
MGKLAAKLWNLLPRSRKAKAAEIEVEPPEEVIVEERAEPAHPHPVAQESVFDAVRNEHMPDEMAHAEPWNTVH